MLLHMCDYHGANGVLGVQRSYPGHVSKAQCLFTTSPREVQASRPAVPDFCIFASHDLDFLRPCETRRILGSVVRAKPAVVTNPIRIQFLLVIKLEVTQIGVFFSSWLCLGSLPLVVCKADSSLPRAFFRSFVVWLIISAMTGIHSFADESKRHEAERPLSTSTIFKRG